MDVLEPEIEAVTSYVSREWGRFEKFRDLPEVQSSQERYNPVRKLNALLIELKRQCSDNQRHLLDMDIGDFLCRCDSEITDGYVEFVKAHNAILRFIIDKLQISEGHSTLSTKLNEPDSSGTPLLHKAIEQCRVETVALLLASGADPHRKSTADQTAIEVLLRIKPTIAQYKFRQMRDLLDLREYFLMHPHEHVTMVSLPSHEVTSKSLQEVLRGESTSVWSDTSVTASPASSGWIHVPSTNGLAVLAILQVIEDQLYLLTDGMITNVVRLFYQHFQPPIIAPGDPYLNYRDAVYWSHEVEAPWVDAQEKVIKKAKYTYSIIVLPCLALSTVQRQRTSRKYYEEWRTASSTSTSERYSAECIVHLERTLDEEYYPGLSVSELETRNKDQVVSRKFRTQELPHERIPLLMVPQLWLWRVGNIIVSAHAEARESALYMSGPYEFAEQQGTKLSPEIRSLLTDLQLGLIVAEYIESFGKGSEIDGARFLPALDIFEEAVVFVLSDVNKYIDNARPSFVNFKIERTFLHKLSDTRSELAMVLGVFQQQKEVLDDLLDDISEDDKLDSSHPLSWLKKPDWSPVKRARSTLTKYEQRVRKIDGDAERIEKTVLNMFELKRTYAGIKDAHSSLLLSTAVIGFTVVTIVFAPLAFLTALFALKIDGFEMLQLNATEGVYRSDYMSGIFISSEFLTIALTVAAVTGSLWYIRRWDRLAEEDMMKVTAGEGKGKPSSGKGAPVRRGGHTDLESQQDGDGVKSKK